MIYEEYNVEKIEKELSWFMEHELIANYFVEISNDPSLEIYYSPSFGGLSSHLLLFNNKIVYYADNSNMILEFSVAQDISKTIRCQLFPDTYRKINLLNFLSKCKLLYNFF